MAGVVTISLFKKTQTFEDLCSCCIFLSSNILSGIKVWTLLVKSLPMSFFYAWLNQVIVLEYARTPEEDGKKRSVDGKTFTKFGNSADLI